MTFHPAVARWSRPCCKRLPFTGLLYRATFGVLPFGLGAAPIRVVGLGELGQFVPWDEPADGGLFDRKRPAVDQLLYLQGWIPSTFAASALDTTVLLRFMIEALITINISVRNQTREICNFGLRNPVYATAGMPSDGGKGGHCFFAEKDNQRLLKGRICRHFLGWNRWSDDAANAMTRFPSGRNLFEGSGYYRKITITL